MGGVPRIKCARVASVCRRGGRDGRWRRRRAEVLQELIVGLKGHSVVWKGRPLARHTGHHPPVRPAASALLPLASFILNLESRVVAVVSSSRRCIDHVTKLSTGSQRAQRVFFFNAG